MKKIFKTLLVILVFFIGNSATAQSIPQWKIADVRKAIDSSKGPTIITFWASFCVPCLEEIPYFQEAVKRNDSAGVKLLLVNLDAKNMYPARIGTIVKRFKFTAPVVFLDETNADIFCPAVDPSWSGAIPASLFINNATGYRKFYEDQLSKKDLEKAIAEMIKK